MFISNWWQVLITIKSCPVSVHSLPDLSLQADVPVLVLPPLPGWPSASPCEDKCSNQTVNLTLGFDGKNGWKSSRFSLRCFLQILEKNVPLFPLCIPSASHSLDRPSPRCSCTSACACTVCAARGPVCRPCDCPSFSATTLLFYCVVRVLPAGL